MNTNALKKFAQEARKKLIGQITAKLNYVLTADSAELRERAPQVKKLQEEITRSSKAQVIDKVAYTWFNRLVALRFMDANDFQLINMRVVTPKDGYTIPEILGEAKQGNVAAELNVNKTRIFDLLDGKIPSTNAQNEVYKLLLIAACNHLHKTLPFLFERISDYSELLLPDDLTSEFSVVQDIRDGMTTADCAEVEIIGWLYQFYISERKDEVFAAKTAVKKEDIPAATQLFTPRWIVEYLVQNTVGKLWLQNRPNSKLREHMPYFIESPAANAPDFLRINSVEELTLLDQACGSGHILVYGFELLYKIYEEEGYNPSEIPELILTKNLFGFEIDERAAQLASLALMLKARSHYRRFFKKEVKPTVLCYQDFPFKAHNNLGYTEIIAFEKDSAKIDKLLKYSNRVAQEVVHKYQSEKKNSKTGEIETIDEVETILRKGEQTYPEHKFYLLAQDTDKVLFFNDEIRNLFSDLNLSLTESLYQDLVKLTQATNLGSLIFPKTTTEKLEETLEEIANKLQTADIFLQYQLEQLQTAVQQLLLLSKKYHCIVDNPPYMGGGNMNKPLSSFVKKQYPDSKADLMACFMEAGISMLLPKGFLGMINQHSWMFLSSYEKLREKLIASVSFDTNLHLGSRTFPEIGGEVVQNTSFTFWNTLPTEKGEYVRLVDYNSTEEKRSKTLEAIQNPDCGWFYTANQKNFYKIPGSPIGYWASTNSINIFKNDILDNLYIPRGGLSTSKNERFLRYWCEVKNEKVGFNLSSRKEALDLGKKWFPHTKGGSFRKWYGNNDYVVNWENDGNELLNFAADLYGSPTRIIKNMDKYFLTGFSWSDVGSKQPSFRFQPMGYIFNSRGPMIFSNSRYLLSLLNSLIVSHVLQIISPTITFNVGEIKRIPFREPNDRKLILWIQEKCNVNIEISKMEWDSHEHSFDFKVNEIIKHQGQDLEETYDLYQQYWKNKFFQLHRNEEELNRQFIDIYGLQEELTPDVPLEDITILKEETVIKNGQLVFQADEVFAQFMSYAVGCMFGRYSLDKPGLILANQGETLEDYFSLVSSVSSVDGGRFMVDGEMVDGYGVDGGRFMVDGVDGGRSGVLGIENELNEYNDGERLQGTAGVATEHELGNAGLSSNQKNAVGGNVQPVRSNQAGGGQHTEQHRRGASTGNQGVSALHSDSTRFVIGAGNATADNRKLEDASGTGSTTPDNRNNEPQKTTPQPNKQTQLPPPTPNPQKNNHQPPTTIPQPPKTKKPTFTPDNDNIIPILDDEWFEDDIVARFYEFLKASFGKANFDKNLAFVEECLGSSIRKYFVKDFYNDHIKRYKKRPIYWLFSSPKGSFNVLIYLHRYTPDTLNQILNGYLKDYREKLLTQIEQLDHLIETGSSAEQTKAAKEKDKIKVVLLELQEYEREILYPLAIQRISIDLDDGVLVNYNKFGKAIKEVKGLNDTATKKKVKGFDWIDTEKIV